MTRGEPLIYSGRVSVDGLVGIPDLLRKDGDAYIAGDIKSGAGEEGGGGDEDDRKPKVRYAVQLALYTDILERLGRSSGRRGFVWDIHGDEVPYELTEVYGKHGRCLWDDYEKCLAEARAIVDGTETTQGAYASGVCKNCVWYSSCVKTLEKADDLTLIPFLGRSVRSALSDRIATIHELAEINPDGFLDAKGKKTIFPGVGPDTLRKLNARARLIAENGKPYLRAPVTFPVLEKELFFDIEVDPMRDICYLHGFVERLGGDNSTERFVHFIVEDATPAQEERAFAASVAYMQASRPCAVYYYSKYERTIYRKLQGKYPAVCSAEVIEELFDPQTAIDLYFDVVMKATEWPTRDYSIKSLARYLGFDWRDPHPSGAASIEWFDRWIRTGDPEIHQRVVEYNEDDCRATRILLDGIRALA
jgi:predicted RecB family nuclease